MASYMVEKDKLTGEYKEVFAKAETYAMLLGIESQEEEEMLMNLIDLLYTAQMDEKPASKIIGNDVEQFCKDYFQEQRGILGFIRGIPVALYRMSIIFMIFGILEIIFLMDEPEFSVWNATMDVSGFIVGLLIGAITSCIALWIIRPFLFRLKKVNATVIAFLVLAIDLAAIIGITINLEEDVVPVPLFPLIAGSVIYVIFYKGYQMYQRYQKTGTIKKAPKDGTLREIYRDTLEKETPKQLGKRFEKINKRRRKKGKSEMTREDFTRKMQNEYKISGIAILVLYVGIWAGSTIADVMQGQWWPDTLVLGGILIVILALCYKLFMPKYMLKLLKQCEKEGTDIIALAERMAEEK